MNSHSSGSAAPVEGTTVVVGNSGSTVISSPAVSGGTVLSKALPPSSNSVIQTPLTNTESAAAAQPASRPSPGPTVTLARPPVQAAGSGATLNGNNAASPAVGAPGTGAASQLVNNGQPVSSASVSAGPHTIKAEPPTTIIQSAPQPTGTVSAPRPPVMASANAGGAMPSVMPMLTPRLSQPSPGQPSVHNIQIPPGKCAQEGLWHYFKIICFDFCKNKT